MSRGEFALHGDAFERPGIRLNLFVGLSALALSWLLLMERAAFGGLALLPLVLGLAGLLPYLVPASWKIIGRIVRRPLPTMPVMVLLSVAMLELLFGEIPLSASRDHLSVEDLLVVTSLLTYAAAQYRLLSMGHQLLPRDLRPHPERGAGDPPEFLPSEAIDPRDVRGEAAALLLSLLGAIAVWYLISMPSFLSDELEADQVRLSGTARRLLTAVWLLGGGIIIARQGFRLMRYYSLNADEAGMILQDELWSETRSEQRRSARWLAWLRRQSDPKKEASL